MMESEWIYLADTFGGEGRGRSIIIRILELLTLGSEKAETQDIVTDMLMKYEK